MGYGDDIMVTGEIKYILKENPDMKFIVGDGKQSWWSEIYENNQAIIQIKDIEKFENIMWIDNYPDHRPYRHYDPKTHKKKYTWDKSFKAKSGSIFLSKEEEIFSKKILEKINSKENKKKLIHIQPSVKLKLGWKNRDWGFEKWQQVVNSLYDKYTFIQTSYANEKKLQNVVNIHGLKFRMACSILSKVDLFLGTEGGMHHAAAALGKKGVVIFGGFIDPSITGYDIHTNLYIKNENSPCGSKKKCNHCEECMKLIKVNFVIAEIIKILK